MGDVVNAAPAWLDGPPRAGLPAIALTGTRDGPGAADEPPGEPSRPTGDAAEPRWLAEIRLRAHRRVLWLRHLWSARPYDDTLTIPAGVTVDVLQIEGAMALVYPRE